MTDTTIFVVSSDSAIRDSLLALITSAGLRAEAFHSLELYLEAVAPERAGCLVLDMRGSDFAGPSRVATFASLCASRPVVVLIDRGDMSVAVRALKDGAADVLEKPYRDGDFLERIRRAALATQHAELHR